MPRVAIYARYSNEELQTDLSIEDQIRVNKQRAEQEGWEIVNCYTDHGISGASTLLRPGIQQMVQDGLAGKYDIVLAEALDRISRDQEDIAGIYKRMTFAGIQMFTLSEGLINEMHIGLKGTMNAIFLKDLADKTRRGLRGRVENGKSGGGVSYGYDVVKKFDDNGEPIRGERTINKEQAAIVKRIFSEYAAGKSPLAIAKKLNEDGVAGPSSKTGWSQSTINGNRKRGTGILNNELYIGEMIWNRQRYVKNPDTGKRVTRLNPEDEWIRKDVPEMRIIEQELWDKVKERQAGLSKSRLTDCQRPKMLLTGLIKCGCCGGGYTKISKTHYGCFSAKKKGMCDNHEVIRQDTLEHMILHALQQHLLNPDMCEVFCNEYTRYMNELRMQHNAQKRGFEKELAKRIKDDDRMVQMVLDGISSTEQMKDRINNNLHRIEELKELLKDKEEAPVLLHPNMGSYYKREIGKLVHSLTEGENLHEAADLIRGLIDKIILTPKESGEGLYIDLKGDLAGILAIAVGNKEDTEKHAVIQQMQNIQVELETATDKALETGDSQLSDLLVAGVGFEPTTFRL